MKRTIILVDEELLLEARQVGVREGKTLTDVIREALTNYVAAHRAGRRLSFVDMGNSGDPGLAHQTDEILSAETDPIDGWAPRQGSERPRPDTAAPTTGRAYYCRHQRNRRASRPC